MMDVLFDPERLVPLIFSALAFVTVIGLALPWLQPDIFASRLKVITDRRRELSQQHKQRLEQRPGLRHTSTTRIDFMRRVLSTLKLSSIIEQPELKKKLIRAGWRGPTPLIAFAFLRLVLPLTFAGFTAVVVFGSPNIQLPGALRLLVCMTAALVGYMLPTLLVTNAIGKRQKQIQKSFPDVLDLTVICIESGLSLEAAFTRVSEESAADAPALSEELGITTAELAFLGDRRIALENLVERTGHPSVKSLVTALIQSEKYGTPLGHSLRIVAQESRDARMSRAEQKAASLPAKLTVPMVTFFLPVLFTVVIGPTIIQVMRTFSSN